MLGGIGIPTAVSVGVGTILALAVSTIATMLFAELFPKNYTIAAPMKSSLWLAAPTNIYLKIFGFLIHFFEWSSNAILKAFKIEPLEDVDSSATSGDLESIMDNSRESGDLDDDTYLVLDRLLQFPHEDVDHAMVPRSRTDVLDPETTVMQARELMASNHTRYPVIDDDHNPIGIVHLFDVLKWDGDPNAPVTELMKESVVVPELMLLPNLVQELRQADEKIACVIDEYGGFVGIVTLEDLAEEILGDITDEHDVEETEEITEQDDTHWLVDGDTPLDEIERAIGHDLPEGDFETIAGLLIAHTGNLVVEGETHTIDLEAEPEDWVEEDAPKRRLNVRVEEIDRHVPSVLAIELVEECSSEDEDDAESDSQASDEGQVR